MKEKERMEKKVQEEEWEKKQGQKWKGEKKKGEEKKGEERAGEGWLRERGGSRNSEYTTPHQFAITFSLLRLRRSR